MVSLLDLPGEIRNMIWDLCLVSPTGMISPLSRRDAYHSGVPGSCSYSGPFFYLQVEETKTHVERCQSTCRIEPNAPTISLSLPRTCRKIFKETNDIFWTKNTFVFRAPHELIYTFKSMGKYAQQRITSLRLCTTPRWGNQMKWLNKTMQLLISQRSSSSLRRLELLVDKESIIYQSEAKLLGSPPRLLPAHHTQTFIPCLQQARCLRNIEKNLYVTQTGNCPFTAAYPPESSLFKVVEETLWEIQEAWEGKLYWGSTILFENVTETCRRRLVMAPLM
ncbi:hypothetical protein L207DRAFT_214450 [Hyaloscypha variabilis F]|uniref:DUF7730 domain-containing protein n=1 Tax=Hyaloscypha variabilis (strain UAMH 11265 / GT02V1 / F) TaxID=1149755 RepID=A0A2J6S6W5_HYAVF|nr:hypothetical protein L207DRAFT_214450 [Hyaloscypha variabilis F]